MFYVDVLIQGTMFTVLFYNLDTLRLQMDSLEQKGRTVSGREYYIVQILNVVERDTQGKFIRVVPEPEYRE